MIGIARVEPIRSYTILSGRNRATVLWIPSSYGHPGGTHVRLFALVYSCCIVAGASAADFVPPEHVSPYGIGFRGDGTGVYPDADPPVAWGEASGKNIRWKAALPNWGYASPVPVGNRVLMLTEPGHQALFPQLTCFDAADGSIVWQVQVAPPGLNERDLEDLRAHDAMLKAAYRIMQPMDGQGHVGEDDPRWGPINAKLAEYGLECHRFKKGYGLLRYVKETDDRWKDLRKRLKEEKGIHVKTTWAEFGRARVGHAFPTPVSDGEHVYVQTRHGTVACYDVASGEGKWIRTVRLEGRKHAEILSSPRLFEKMLLTGFLYTGGEEGIHAWDKATGEKLWATSANAKPVTEGYKSRNGGSLVVMTVGEQPVLCSGGGAVIRLPDGKAYGAGINRSCATVAIDEAGDRVFGWGSSDRGSKTWGLRLALEGGDLSVEEIFSVGKTFGGMSALYVDGVLIGDEYRIDPTTGWPVDLANRADAKRLKKIEEARASGDEKKLMWQHKEFAKRHKDAPQCRHTMLAAAGRVYGLYELGAKHADADRAVGVTEVYSTAGEKLARNVLLSAEWDEARREKWTRQGFPPGFSYACQMNIAGERLYACSQDFLYCIGE